MKANWIVFGILTVAVLAVRHPVFAHEECDEDQPARVAAPQKGAIAAAPARGAPNVTIKLFQYQPGRITVPVGTTVTWLNEDDIFHTVTADDKDGGFAAPLDGKGKSFSFTFSRPGIYAYHCDRHGHMRGEIEVH